MIRTKPGPISPAAFAAPPKSAEKVGYHPDLQSSGCGTAAPFTDEPPYAFVAVLQEDMWSKPLLIKQY
jgi:hypothetical protein